MSNRKVACLVAALSLALAFCTLRFVLRNNLLEHDLVGHLAMATFIREHLWPRFAGWDPRFFCGTPIGEWYPPLTAWLAATLGFAVGVPLGLKLVVALAVLATPPALFAFARGYGLGREAALVAAAAGTAYLALDRQELGGNFHSTFVVGNVTNGVVVPLVFVALAYLPRVDRDWRDWRRVGVPALLLALVLLTHLVGGMVALGFVAVERALAVTRDRARLPATLAYLMLAFALSAFFCVPLVLTLRFGARNPYSYNQYPTALIENLGYYALLILVFAKARQRRELAPVALGLAVLFAGASFVFNDFLPRILTLHLHRFVPYERLFALVLIAALIEPLLSRRPRLTDGITGALALVALVGTLAIPSAGVRDQPVPPLEPLDARVMVVATPANQASDHALQHLVALRTHNDVAKGLFIELGANASALLDLERVIAKEPVRAWGIVPDPPEALRKLPSLAAARLRHLGFGWVLTEEPLQTIAGLDFARALDGGFTLHRAGAAPLVEIWNAPLSATAARDFDTRAEAWFLDDAGPLPIRAAAAPPPSPDARLTGWRIDRDGQWLSFDVSQPAPVLVKVSYAPEWQAIDSDGKRVPISEVAPHLMLVEARGHTTLKYVQSPMSQGLKWLAAIAVLLTLAVAAFSRLRTRRA